jgi:uncharacterized protein (TIGR04141 family)
LSPEENTEIGYFGIGLRSGRKQTYTEIAIEDYVAELKAGQIAEIADMKELRASHEIRTIKDGEGDRGHKRKLYECFTYELTHKNNTYVLFAGDWYLIDKKFHSIVEAEFLRLVTKKPFVASTTAKNERDFIAELDAKKIF